MDFLNPEKPTRVTMVKASVRADKNLTRHLRLVFSMAVAANTPWLPTFVSKTVLGECARGAVDRVRFDGEIEHVNCSFARLPEQRPHQHIPDVTIGGCELRRSEDGIALRFGFEVQFRADLAAFLAEAFGADVFLRCESAQPDLPGMAAPRPKGGVRRKDRTVAIGAPAGGAK